MWNITCPYLMIPEKWHLIRHFLKNTQLSTGPRSNTRVFHLHVNNHCTSQEVNTCALVKKKVPMKSWWHLWKYIKYTLHICINDWNRTRKILSKEKNNWLSSFSLVNYRCETLRTHKYNGTQNKIESTMQQIN